ncbi:MAG: haloacid dehalogenase [Chloroflexota bacterium]
MDDLTARLEQIADKARAGLSVKDSAREKALELSRDTVRHSADAIRSVHRGDYDEARSRLAQAQGLLEQIQTALRDQPEFLYTGFVFSAQKEYAEGCITLSLITGNAIPDPEEIGIDYAAYLNGLGEAVGELRRHVLDLIRKGDIARCEEVLAAMDDMYGVLVTMDFPEAMTGGLRRTTDSVRGILERTRGDLTIAFRQRDLEEKLGSFEKRISAFGHPAEEDTS